MTLRDFTYAAAGIGFYVALQSLMAWIDHRGEPIAAQACVEYNGGKYLTVKCSGPRR